MSTLIKGGRQLLQNIILFVCTILAVAIIWRGVIFGDLLAAWFCIALGFCLVFTGIALVDYRKSIATSDNGL
ncbi:MAG TPA: hypothetical protein VGP99_02790 [Tepidisphaeraceae bacterium]|nr:hypothetical protein [Tepidisphaeraceae bacterium]